MSSEYQRIIDEARADGEARGVIIGEARGVIIGEARGKDLGKADTARLMSMLARNGRYDDIIRAGTDVKYLNQLLTQYQPAPAGTAT